MSNTILLKRSSVSGKVPLTTDLSLGELAINTYDGKAYIKMNNGADAIVELTKANLGNVTGTLAVANGGTGATTLTGYVKGAGTSALTASSTIPGSDVSGNIAGNAANVTGTVAVANGGTGQTTANAALNALLPSQTGNSTKVLSTDGTNAAWTTVAAGGSGTVTSVSVTSANGLAGTVATSTTTPAITLSTTVTGIVKGNGTSLSAAVAADFPTLNQNTTGTAANVTGTVALANGGTGATTQAGAANAVLPSQTSNTGKFLTTDGSNVSWATAGGGGSTPTLTPLGPVVVQEDFLGGPSNGNYAASQSGTAGVFRWVNSASATNSGYDLSTANHPGVFKVGYNGNSGDVCYMYGASGIYVDDIDTCIMIVKWGANSNNHRFGFTSDFTTISPSNAIWFTTVGGLNATTRQGGSQNQLSAGSRVANTWYELKIVRVSSSQFDFYVNGTLAASSTNTIPTGVTLYWTVTNLSNGDGSSEIYVDYVGIKTKTYTSRG